MSHLSGYRIMWVMVMFDLPVLTKAQRKRANGFRLFLKDQGFQMAQLSVYMKHVSGKDGVAAVCAKVEGAIPPGGIVDVLQFTDKQYENIICFRNKQRQEPRENPGQLALF